MTSWRPLRAHSALHFLRPILRRKRPVELRCRTTSQACAVHRVIAGVAWQNGWGGMAGSIADRTMRQGLADAAKQIADALVQNLSMN